MKEQRLYLDARTTSNITTLHSFCYIRGAGHYRTHPHFQSIVMTVDFLEIFWCISGFCYFELDNKLIKMSQNQTFCIFPGDEHCFHVSNEPLELYYVCYENPGLDGLIKTFDLKRGVRDTGMCPRETFDNLISAIRGNTLKSLAKANVLGYEILSNYADPFPHTQQSVATAFQELVRENCSNSSFSIGEAAEILQVHRSTLHRIFLQDSGISPQEYLTTCRLQNALQLLENREYSIKEISAMCGFSNENYFARLFKNVFQITPSELRKGGTVVKRHLVP